MLGMELEASEGECGDVYNHLSTSKKRQEMSMKRGMIGKVNSYLHTYGDRC
jgi:hypothetical protein